MQKKPYVFFIALLLLALFLVVTYLVQTDPFSNIRQVSQQQPPNHNQSVDPVLALFSENCATCHGAFGQGLSGNPTIKGTVLNVEQIKQVIVNGRGDMPAFPDLSADQLSQLARLVKQF